MSAPTASSRRPASLARSGAFSSLFVIYGAVAAFAATLVVSNGIGAHGSGLFFDVMALFTIGISLSVFGADTGLVRTVSAQSALPHGTSVRELFGFALAPTLVVSVVVSAGASLWASPWITPGMEESTRIAVWVSAPFLVAAAVMTLGFGVLRGTHRVIAFTALQNVVLPTLRVLGVMVAVWIGTTVWSGNTMGLLAAAWSIPVLMVLAIVLVQIGPDLRGHSPAATATTASATAAPAAGAVAAAETRHSFWSFSAARGFSALVEAVLEWIDVILVGVFLGPAAAGVYGAINRCVRVGVMVEHTARIVTGPAISAALATAEHARARSVFVNTTRVLVALAWPFYLTLMLFGHGLLGFFGHAFPSGAPVLFIICPAMMLAMSAGGVQSVLLMSGKSRWQLINKISSLVVAAVLNLTLIPVWGIAGAATAWGASVIVDSALAASQVHFSLRIRATVAEIWPSVVLSLGVVGVGGTLVRLLLGPGLLGLGVHAVVVCGLYLVLLRLFRARLGINDFLKARRAKKS